MLLIDLVNVIINRDKSIDYKSVGSFNDTLPYKSSINTVFILAR